MSQIFADRVRLKALQQMLHEVNPYVSHINHAVDRMRAQGGVDIRLIIRADGCPDPRRYNAPSVPEIAVLLPGGGYSEGVANRDIVLHAHSGSLRRITKHTVHKTRFIMSYCFP